MPFPEHTESGNLQLAMSTLVQGFSAGAQRRSDRADQLAGDSAAMWSIAMTTPTVNAGLGFRTANESGAGRTRVEANTPVGPQTQGG